MSSKLIKQEGNKLILQLEVELDPSSMLNSEEQIAQALNEAGVDLSQAALKQFDTNGEAIEVGGERFSSKGHQKKNTRRPTE